MRYARMKGSGPYEEMDGLTEAELLGLLPEPARERATERLNGETAPGASRAMGAAERHAPASGPGPKKTRPKDHARKRAAGTK